MSKIISSQESKNFKPGDLIKFVQSFDEAGNELLNSQWGGSLGIFLNNDDDFL